MLVTKGGNLVADLGRVTGFDAKGVAERDCEIVPPSTWPANAPPRKRDVKVVDMRDVLVVAPQDPMDKDSFAPQLADNGGPTKTHALCTGRQRGDFFLDVFWDFCIKGSLARDQAWPTPNDPHNPYACEALDQRGARRADGLCDIGAYEAP